MDIKAKKQLTLAILFSMGFLFLLLSRVDWAYFPIIAGRLNIKYLFTAFSIFILGNLFRALRFYKLDHMNKKLTHWWNINVFYNFITATLPGGLGEAATVYVLKRFSQFNLFSAFRILLLSRLMDLFALSALFFISAMLINRTTPYRSSAIWISGMLFLISSLALLRSFEQVILKLMQQLPRQSNLVNKTFDKLSELLIIAKEQHSNNSLRITLLQSVLTVLGGAVALHILLQSLGVVFTPVQSVYCYGVYLIFQIIPIQGIAGLGTQAAWWALALNAAGYNGSEAIALGFVLHVTFYAFITSLGFTLLPYWLKRRKRSFP